MSTADSDIIPDELLISDNSRNDKTLHDQDLVFTWVSFLNFIQASYIRVIPSSDLSLSQGSRLGSGQTMIVTENLWKNRNASQNETKLVAVKQPRTDTLPQSDDQKHRPSDETTALGNFTLELRALAHGTLRNHPNIVRLLGVTWVEHGMPALVVERASSSWPTLAHLLEGPELPGVQKSEILAGITDGLIAVHSISIIHGDLKPENILLFQDESMPYLCPKLSDFAFAYTWNEGQSSGGTQYWNAPECCDDRNVFTGDRRSPLRDRYSLGLVFWNVFRNELPFVGLEPQSITQAKEDGYLVKILQNLKETEKYEAFLFESINIAEEYDDEDAILSIVEVMEVLLQPEPKNRVSPYEEHISTKLRTRRREMSVEAIHTDGITVTGNLLPELEDELADLNRRVEASRLVETAIRVNVTPILSSATRSAELTFAQHETPQEIMELIAARQNTVVNSSTDNRNSVERMGDREEGDAHWFLAQQKVATDEEAAREHLLKAANLANESARVNYLYRCLRDSVPVLLSLQTHVQWLVQSHTGPQIFKMLEVYSSNALCRRLKARLEKSLPLSNYKEGLRIFHEAFVHNVLGSSYAPHDRVFIEGKWKLLVDGKETTFENFRQGIPDILHELPPNALHTAALYGTGDVVRDLVQNYGVDLETKAQTQFINGTALQAAFLRHNMQTVQALVNLGADVLTLFSEQLLEAFLVQGDRDTLHWLHHLIPLMSHEKNREQARNAFSTILISSRALQGLIIQRNWSLFLGVLEIAETNPSASIEQGMGTTMSVAASLRRVEFLTALLLHQDDFHSTQLEPCSCALLTACGPAGSVSARPLPEPRHYLGLDRGVLATVESPSDFYAQILIVETLLQYGVPVEAKDAEQTGRTPLFWAIHSNRLLLARLLVEQYGADPMVRETSEGSNLLFLAVYRDNYWACKFLLSLPSSTKRVLLEQSNMLGETAMHQAASKSNPAIIKLLLLHDGLSISPQFFGRNVFHLAAERANKRGFELIFDHVEEYFPKNLQEMLFARDAVGMTPLHLFFGSNPEDGSTNKSAQSQDYNMWRILHKLRRSCTPPRHPESASSSQAPDISRERVFDLNHRDAHELTPLHHLVLFNGDFAMTLEAMLKYGADLWSRSRIGAMPLQIPVHSRKPGMVAVILEHLLHRRNTLPARYGGPTTVTGLDATRALDTMSGHDPPCDLEQLKRNLDAMNEYLKSKEREERVRLLPT